MVSLNKILVLSDLHVGSKYAVMPERFGNTVPNAIQRKILDEWIKMVDREKDVDAVFILGDIVDGLQRVNCGRELWTSDLDEQISAAQELVNMIDYDSALVVYGTPYHTEEGLNLDALFAKSINAKAHGWELSVKPNKSDEAIHLAHQVSTSGAPMMYRTTPIAKELMMALLHEKELFKYRAIIRAHAHYFVYVAFSNQFGWINPCWQDRNPYMTRKGLGLMPKLGYVVLNTPEDSSWGVIPKTFSISKPDLVMF